MYKVAVYGKGGIGKSTTVSNMAAALAQKGMKVMQIGCDPKADSTINLLGGRPVESVLDLIRRKNQDIALEEMVSEGYGGIQCVEAGGPTPGLGCAGRGIVNALEMLDKKNAYGIYKPDVVFYDVLGDVVCGGFTMPIREGYADKVFVVTSGEAMAVHAAMNIALAVDTFRERGYAALGGIIVNRKNVPGEEAKIAQLSEDTHTPVTGWLSFSQTVREAEELHKTVLEAFPGSEMAQEYRTLADAVMDTLRK
ncbi:MAG TPA: nitrogenase iron protein [Treponema sp.]|nr:nitrogenase iron protein [Treponema sp.]